MKVSEYGKRSTAEPGGARELTAITCGGKHEPKAGRGG